MLSGTRAERANRIDRLIVYATIGDDGFRLAALQRRLHELGVPYGPDEVEQALARLDIAYIAGRDPDGIHRYRVPLFVDMLREGDPDLALEQELAEAKRAQATDV